MKTDPLQALLTANVLGNLFEQISYSKLESAYDRMVVSGKVLFFTKLYTTLDPDFLLVIKQTHNDVLTFITEDKYKESFNKKPEFIFDDFYKTVNSFEFGDQHSINILVAQVEIANLFSKISKRIETMNTDVEEKTSPELTIIAFVQTTMDIDDPNYVIVHRDNKVELISTDELEKFGNFDESDYYSLDDLMFSDGKPINGKTIEAIKFNESVYTVSLSYTSHTPTLVELSKSDIIALSSLKIDADDPNLEEVILSGDLSKAKIVQDYTVVIYEDNAMQLTETEVEEAEPFSDVFDIIEKLFGSVDK